MIKNQDFWIPLVGHYDSIRLRISHENHRGDSGWIPRTSRSSEDESVSLGLMMEYEVRSKIFPKPQIEGFSPTPVDWELCMIVRPKYAQILAYTVNSSLWNFVIGIYASFQVNSSPFRSTLFNFGISAMLLPSSRARCSAINCVNIECHGVNISWDSMLTTMAYHGQRLSASTDSTTTGGSDKATASCLRNFNPWIRSQHLCAVLGIRLR